jgi:hypothetical protein
MPDGIFGWKFVWKRRRAPRPALTRGSLPGEGRPGGDSIIDPAKRVALFKEVQQIVAVDLPDINLDSPAICLAYNWFLSAIMPPWR